MSAVWSNYCFNTKIRPPFCFRQFGRSADIFVNYVELVFIHRNHRLWGKHRLKITAYRKSLYTPLLLGLSLTHFSSFIVFGGTNKTKFS